MSAVVLKNSNRAGIPCLKSSSAVVSDTTLTVTFPVYRNFPKNFSGVAILNIYQTFTATGLTAVNLIIQDTTIPLLADQTTAATATQITGPGIYEVFIDNTSNTIQLV